MDEQSTPSNPSTIRFNAARTSVGYITLGMGSLFTTVFVVVGVMPSMIPDSLASRFVIVGLGVLVGLLTIWYWRESLNRTTQITAKGAYILVEEYKRNKCIQRQEFGANQIKNVYTTRIWGHGPSYEVWLKLRNGKDVSVIFTWYSQTDAIAIRHFIATRLDVAENIEHDNRLWR